jgi:hypothetical protein
VSVHLSGHAAASSFLKCRGVNDLLNPNRSASRTAVLASELQSLDASHEKGEVEDDMKFQNKIRMQMVMVGLGAALLMAGSARAQQDMDPTYFEANPGTPAVSKTVVVKSAQSSQAAKENGSAESAMAVANGSDVTLEAGVTRAAIVDGGVVLILLAGIVLIARYAVAAARGARVPRISKVASRYTPVSAETAQ